MKQNQMIKFYFGLDALFFKIYSEIAPTGQKEIHFLQLVHNLGSKKIESLLTSIALFGQIPEQVPQK